MVARIYISGPIGSPPDEYWGKEGTTLADVRRQYESFDGVSSVMAFINSPGGEVREGFAIHDFLQALPYEVTTVNEGKAWSIASVIFMAGQKRMVAPNSTILIHNPLAGVLGNAEQMREIAEYLDSIGDDIAAFYAQKTGQNVALLKDMMNSETELNAQDAVTMNFATGILESTPVLAWIKSEKQMDKKSQTLLDKLRAILNEKQEEEVVETAETEDQAQEEEVQTPSELELAQKRIEELEAKVAEADQLKATVQAQNEALEKVMLKLQSIEDKPVVNVKTPMGGGNQKPKQSFPISNQLKQKLEKWDELIKR